MSNNNEQKSFTSAPDKLVDYDLFNPFNKSFIYKDLRELTSCIF